MTPEEARRFDSEQLYYDFVEGYGNTGMVKLYDLHKAAPDVFACVRRDVFELAYHGGLARFQDNVWFCLMAAFAAAKKPTFQEAARYYTAVTY